VHALLNDKPVVEPSFMNTCYSLIAPDYGVSVAAVYQVQDGKIVSVKDAVGMSPIETSQRDRKVEAAHAVSWYKNITTEMFGWASGPWPAASRASMNARDEDGHPVIIVTVTVPSWKARA